MLGEGHTGNYDEVVRCLALSGESPQVQRQLIQLCCTRGWNHNRHGRCGHSFLKCGLTQGNISNKAGFVPCPVIILENSAFIKTAWNSFVLTCRMEFWVQVITNKYFAQWMSHRTLGGTRRNMCSEGLSCARQSVQHPGKLEHRNTVALSQAWWQTKCPLKCPRLLSWVSSCWRRSRGRQRKAIPSSCLGLSFP